MVSTYNIFKVISHKIRNNKFTIQYRDEINSFKNANVFVQNIISDGSNPIKFGIVVRGQPNKGETSGKMMKEILDWNNKVFKIIVKDCCDEEQHLEVSTRIGNINDAGTDDLKRSVLTCDVTFIVYFRKERWK